MTCPHLIQLLPHGVHCRKNGGAETSCSPGVCRHCLDGGGVDAQWKLEAWRIEPAPTPPQSLVKVKEPQSVSSQGGPGTELTKLLKSLGLTEASIPRVGKGCGCKDLAAEMNINGAAWVKEHQEEIVARLVENAGQVGWSAKLLAGGRAACKYPNLALAAVGGVDSACGWLVDEALRRAARGVGGAKTSLALLPHS